MVYPGLLDIHTHEDLEAELDPGLPGVLRHGTTSVDVGNCSIGLAFGNQRFNHLDSSQDPIVDCFARQEGLQNRVVHVVKDKAIMVQARHDYLSHLDDCCRSPTWLRFCRTQCCVLR